MLPIFRTGIASSRKTLSISVTTGHCPRRSKNKSCPRMPSGFLPCDERSLHYNRYLVLIEIRDEYIGGKYETDQNDRSSTLEYSILSAHTSIVCLPSPGGGFGRSHRLLRRSLHHVPARRDRPAAE